MQALDNVVIIILKQFAFALVLPRITYRFLSHVFRIRKLTMASGEHKIWGEGREGGSP